MTVKELIKELEKYPDDRTVKARCDWNDSEGYVVDVCQEHYYEDWEHVIIGLS